VIKLKYIIGLPHAHIVAKISDTPDQYNTDDEKLMWIAHNICAKFQDISPNNSNELNQRNERINQLVRKFLIHRCAAASNGCLDKNGNCKRGYKDTAVNYFNSFSPAGFPVYCRPTNQDLSVVPYHADIVLDWEGHINTEFCGKSYCVVYLYKYLFKGNKKTSATITSANSTSSNQRDPIYADIDPKDEIKLHLRGQMHCSMSSMYRIMGYQSYPATSPTVIEIKVKLPSQIQFLRSKNQVCDLEVYFCRPQLPQFDDMKYTTFFKEWDYNKKIPARFKHTPIDNNEDLRDIYQITFKYEE
jgi:hypothetical protein